MSLRDQIAQAQDIEQEMVDVPEWGNVRILVKGMTGKERSDLMKEGVTKDGKMNFTSLYPQLIIACSYDPETGERVFEPADKDFINSKSAKAQERIARKALELSGMTQEALEELKGN